MRNWLETPGWSTSWIALAKMAARISRSVKTAWKRRTYGCRGSTGEQLSSPHKPIIHLYKHKILQRLQSYSTLPFLFILRRNSIKLVKISYTKHYFIKTLSSSNCLSASLSLYLLIKFFHFYLKCALLLRQKRHSCIFCTDCLSGNNLNECMWPKLDFR